MLDVLKSLAGGRKARTQQSELQALIETAREERNALSTMLTQVTSRSTKLAATGRALEQIETRATAATTALEDVGKRVEALERRAATLGEVEKRVQTLMDAAAQAQKQAEKVEELSAKATAAQATLEGLKRERAAFDKFREELRGTSMELKDVRRSVDQAMALRAELDQARSAAGQLAQEFTRLRDTSRDAREDSVAATEAVRELERKLSRVAQLQDISKATEEKITALNALAEYVGQKTRALESQKHVIDRAVVEANRLNDMVWNMDVQIGQVNDSLKQAAHGGETLARIEQLVRETETKLEAATRLRDDVGRETARMEKDGSALLQGVRSSLDRLTIERREIEAFEARLLALQGTVADAEQRMEALGSRERQLSQLPQRIDEFSRQFAALKSSAEDLGRKQASLDTLQEQLGQVQELSARTGAQYDALRRSRAELDALRSEIQEFHQSYTQAIQLRDKLSADRVALEAFAERLGAFRARTPELEASMESVLTRLTQVDDGMRHATRLSEMAADLEHQLTRVAERVEFVTTVEGRLNALQALAADVDGKLAAQLERRAELESLRTLCDGVIAQMLDAQQKIEAVAALQGKILPMDLKISILQDRITKTGERIKDVQREDDELTAQEVRLAELVEASKSLAGEVAERHQQTRALSETVARADAAREDLLAELARIQTRQREVVAHAESAEDQLRRAEALYKVLEQRRSQLAFSEKKLGDVEARLGELAHASAAIEQRMKVLAAQESVVEAVRAEVQAVHGISAKSRADLQYAAGQRDEIAAVRTQLGNLHALAADTEEKIALIESRRQEVEEVQARTTLIANLLQDVRVNLETVGEQKAVVDHLTERLATVQFVMQEAQNTLRLLNQERELAERIEQSIRQLRARTGSDKGEGRRTA
jgi:chromosome segregation ATPase